jgi:cell wall-associated NlpC family hydrolase
VTGNGASLATAAEALVGTPFRLHGRDVARGLDCLGLVAAALAAIGRPIETPSGYSIRRLEIGRFLALASRAGLIETRDLPHPGDVFLVRPGPAQHHLVIAASARSFVHAHAGLGRVVNTPAPLPWPIERQWRLVSE